MKKKYIISIYYGLSTAFALVVIITSFCISSVLFLKMQKVMEQDLNKRINDILAIGITKLDADAHSKLTKPEQESTPDYIKLKKALREIRDGSTDVRYVYTFRHINGHNFQFIVDAEEEKGNTSHIGDVYTGLNIDEFINSTNKIYVSKKYDKDKWGTWLTGYVKIITTTGKMDGFLCIDISAESIIRQERKAITDIFIIGILIIIIFVGLGIYIARRIAKPLSLLEKDMILIKDLKLDINLEIKSRFKEIVNIKNVEDNMKIGLQSFKKYVPADLVSKLILLNKEAILGGEKKELTVLFTDIKDFTSISEKLNLELLTEYLAEYLEGMTSIIIKHHGTVDKYIGDSIMAFWGAPLDIEDHAYQTCLAALECQQFLNKMNLRFKNAGKPEFITRFGINSGEMIVGNFGYEKRFNYTVSGDNVNLASRLEGINKLYKTSILIGENTYNIVKDKFACRKIDIVAVKGKVIGISIYELISSKEDMPTDLKTFLDLFNKALELYFNRNWEQAIKFFEKTKKINPNDFPSELFIKRCNEFIKKPPPVDWNGINFLHEK